MAGSSPRFSFGLFGVVDYPPGGTYGPRTMGDYELVWIINGSATWISDQVRHPAPAGTVWLARPGMSESYVFDRSHPTRHAYVHFWIHDDDKRLGDERRWPLAVSLPEQDVIRPLFRHLLRLLHDRPQDWQALASSAMGHLLLAFVSGQHHAGWEASRPLPAAITRAMTLAAEQWAAGTCRPFTLGELAAHAGVSPGHLCRCFQRRFGMGVMEALRLLRLERAAVMLARSDLPINQVATRTGFDDAFHFSRLFRRRYGASPRRFRKEIIGKRKPFPALPEALVDLARRFWE
jgi:AraC-like DNA-binding protein